MVPVDLDLFRVGAPLLLAVVIIIFFLWSIVEHPLRTQHLDMAADAAFARLKDLIKRRGLFTVEQNEEEKRIRVRAVLKIVDFLIYRCWSKELLFRVMDEESRVKLIVSCRPSPFRLTASSKNPHLFSEQKLDQLVNDMIASPK